MTITERNIKELFLRMLQSYEALPVDEQKLKYLQTTKITQWLSARIGEEVKAGMVVKLFEERGYTFIFETGGFHHWVLPVEV